MKMKVIVVVAVLYKKGKGNDSQIWPPLAGQATAIENGREKTVKVCYYSYLTGVMLCCISLQAKITLPPTRELNPYSISR